MWINYRGITVLSTEDASLVTRLMNRYTMALLQREAELYRLYPQCVYSVWAHPDIEAQSEQRLLYTLLGARGVFRTAMLAAWPDARPAAERGGFLQEIGSLGLQPEGFASRVTILEPPSSAEPAELDDAVGLCPDASSKGCLAELDGEA